MLTYADVPGESRHVFIPADGSKLHLRDNLDNPLHVAAEKVPIKQGGTRHHSCLCTFDVAVDGASDGTRFTCFTGTKVQKLTQKRYDADTSVSLVGSHEFLGSWQVLTLLTLLVQQYKY